MTSFANNWVTNLAVTILVATMVFLLPWADRRICRKLRLNLTGGLSGNPRSDSLMQTRQFLLYAIFGSYLLAVAYLVFFSRSATKDYQVHIALFSDLKNAVKIDFGFLGFIRTAFTDGFPVALSHVQVEKAEDISQVYMNIMLFVPMGYLLPYLFAWFRSKVKIRPALACMIISFLIENLQLIFRRGFYDMDDLVSNTAGGVIGQFLFISVAYVVTHPDWRKEAKSYRRWKRNAKSRTLYPFARRMGLTRITLQASGEDAIWDFYVMNLGFRLVKQIVPLDSPDTDLLLQMGRMQLEVHCSNKRETLPPQTLTLAVRRLPAVIRRLEKNNIPVSEIAQDVYTGHRCVRVEGPDQVQILILEK